MFPQQQGDTSMVRNQERGQGFMFHARAETPVEQTNTITNTVL